MSIFSCHNKTSYCSFFNSTIEGHFSLSTFYELVQRIMEVTKHLWVIIFNESIDDKQIEAFAFGV